MEVPKRTTLRDWDHILLFWRIAVRFDLHDITYECLVTSPISTVSIYELGKFAFMLLPGKCPQGLVKAVVTYFDFGLTDMVMNFDRFSLEELKAMDMMFLELIKHLQQEALDHSCAAKYKELLQPT